MSEGQCLIGYKTQFSRGGVLFGYDLDKIEPCCNVFKRWFQNTRDKKLRDNQIHSHSINGINVVSQGNEIKAVLYLSTGNSTFMESELKFCPFCGTKVVVKETKVVELREKFKKVHDGYEEIAIR